MAMLEFRYLDKMIGMSTLKKRLKVSSFYFSISKRSPLTLSNSLLMLISTLMSRREWQKSGRKRESRIKIRMTILLWEIIALKTMQLPKAGAHLDWRIVSAPKILALVPNLQVLKMTFGVGIECDALCN